MRNEEVVEAFTERKVASNSTGSLTSTGDCLYSYQTCIAEYDDDGNLWYNKTKYSTTTSKHQYILKRLTVFYIEVDSIPRGTSHIVKS